MKKVRLNKKTIVIAVLCLAILLFLFFSETTLGMTHYQETGFVTGLVTASSLYVRSGPRKEL